MPAPKSNSSSSTLSDLSSQLAAAVERASTSIVAIHARRRIPSSGVLWRDGVIVSASHTVRRDGDVAVTLPSGDSATATVAGRDPGTDVVALRLVGSATAPIPAAARANADSLRIGSLVLAVGRPGPNATASFGIVSALVDDWRSAHGARLDRVLRLDLAVYDGFSGGAAVDATGGLLGLNNSALARGTAAALTVSTVDRIVDELLAHGHMPRPYIGVAVQPVSVTPGQLRQHGLAHDAALMVVAVAEGSPAERAGLLPGDVLLKASEQPLERPVDLLDALAAVAERGTLTITLLRGGSMTTVSVAPVDRGGNGT